MKPRSAKNKGKRLQNKVRDLILEKFNSLESDDVRSITMGESGEDILLSPAARKLFPFSVECKHTPIVIFKRNRTKTYVALEFEKLLELLNE